MSSESEISGPSADEEFIQLLIAEQSRLLYYITRLLGDPHAAQNVLQETNLVLWRKSGEFRPGTSFSAWSNQVAYWQVQAYVRDKTRDRHVFSEELVSQLATQDRTEGVDAEHRVALRHCLQQVGEPNAELLRMRYADSLPIAQIADRVGRTQTAVRAALMRIRRALQRCIEKKIGQH